MNFAITLNGTLLTRATVYENYEVSQMRQIPQNLRVCFSKESSAKVVYVPIILQCRAI